MSLSYKAKSLGASDFGRSNKPDKRFFVVYNGKKIHFGSNSRQTYFDIKDEKKRKAWIARHSVNTDDKGQKFINKKTSPLYWSSKLLW